MPAHNRILDKMLERLFASLVNGPSLNARPHASRQRIDLTHLSRLGDISGDEVLRGLLSGEACAKLKAKIPSPKRLEDQTPDEELSDEDRAARRAWKEQQALLQKLRVIAEDAKTYEQDTGVHVLYVGFPLLSLPPGSFAGSRGGGVATRRILAPVAFVPVSVSVKRGTTSGIELACKGEGTDRVVPNVALLAWLEQQTGKAAKELFEDEGDDPWREVYAIVTHVCATLELEVPTDFRAPVEESAPTPPLPLGEGGGERASDNENVSVNESDLQIERPLTPALSQGERGQAADSPSGARRREIAGIALIPAPRADETDPKPTLVQAAILGLFPMANQGLIRDMKSMAAGETPLAGPVESFVQANVQLDAMPVPEKSDGALDGAKRPRVFNDERLVTAADPCQSRAVKLARQSRGLVIHGPPGTGKSQTISNIIGDHISRGMRVLFVCDKRTALDVVANRLTHMGLGRLCAVVHDPQRDQRDLYRNVRQQLDDLPDVTTSDPRADKRLVKIDEELQALHAELTRTHESLMSEDAATGLSFHELAGKWLETGISAPISDQSPRKAFRGLPDASIALDEAALADTTLAELDASERALHEIFKRGISVAYATNPWRKAGGISVEDFVSKPMEPFRAAMRGCVEAAGAADATVDPDIPPFEADVDLPAAGAARAELAGRLERVLQQTDAATLGRWSKQPPDAVERARKRLIEAAAMVEAIRSMPLDPSLAMVIRPSVPTIPQLNEQLAILAAYIDASGSFLGFLAFGKKRSAAGVLNPYGVTVSRPGAQQVHAFLGALRARLIVQSLLNELCGASGSGMLVDDAALVATLDAQRYLLDLLHDVHTAPPLAGLAGEVSAVLAHPVAGESLIRGLVKSPARAGALAELEASLDRTTLFNRQWLAGASQQVRAGKTASEAVGSLNDQIDTLEGVLRTRQGLVQLPPPLAVSAETLVMQSAGPEPALGALKRAVYAAEISRRLKNDPHLRNIDGQRMAGSFERYRQLDDQKRQLVRDTVLHRWTSVQKERLLASTGSRLNGVGADLRRRLTMRGERAMRLRQVISVGQSIEGGDPLFDLCPVWMASPETVAQVFPREALFDVIIFDEASQCRLEEALPVLLRGKRVVIAGDPKQLPPTRFFESAVAQSEDEEIESDQQLFELQQGEIEDLLAAALNLSIEQCYLDVHYRSRNADLIAFSNEQFYGSRLQAIPGHPSNRAKYAPLTLYHADGVYKEGENEIEATRVCTIVRDLLKRGEPPSIGIACMNVNQRDLILEKLDELSVSDPTFGRKLGEARTRTGEGSFEGLFVKNLENVQGDERDHIIISTTYGPDEKGRFYKRFGPLGRAGGGRRMNVLVTRARQEVHLVTSIPPQAYRAIPPVPPRQQPGGGWLLFAYLHFAEKLKEAYEVPKSALPLPPGESGGEGALELDDAESSKSVVEPTLAPTLSQGERGQEAAIVNVLSTKYPSSFAESLANQIAHQAHTGSDVHWGNDGFCVDVALRHPAHGEDVTLGLLVDGSRFAQAQDAVEWDVFRTAIHQSQGWTLHRLWTPHFFRDPTGCLAAIQKEAMRIAQSARDADQDGIRVGF